MKFLRLFSVATFIFVLSGVTPTFAQEIMWICPENPNTRYVTQAECNTVCEDLVPPNYCAEVEAGSSEIPESGIEEGIVIDEQFCMANPAAPECQKKPGGGTAASANKLPTYELTNPLAGAADNPQQLIGRVTRILTGVAGSLALMLFVWGGLLMITSRGNSKQVDEGKEKLIQATIGLFIIFTAYALVTQIFRFIGAS